MPNQFKRSALKSKTSSQTDNNYGGQSQVSQDGILRAYQEQVQLARAKL